MTHVDLLIDHIGQCCVVPSDAGRPQRGAALGTLGIISDAAIAIHDGRIAAVGTRENILREYEPAQTLDAAGRLVTPGLIDPHTHLIWAGDRAGEFEQRLGGASYQEIAAAGGGINRTVRETRNATLVELVRQAAARLDRMLVNGTTTAEVKTGYGLDLHTELTMLDAIARLDSEHPIDLIPTFLGAHTVPPEHTPDEYVEFVCNQTIPAAKAWRDAHWPDVLYCDVFCEENAFDLAQTRRILQAAHAHGLPLRVHADEFNSLGGVRLAVEMGAASVDHLLVTTPDDVALLGKSDTAAVLLPATPFGLNIPNTSPARALVAAGAIVVLATDCNPGTAWCESMQFVLSLATRALGLTQGQALAAATINAAYAVGKIDEIGSLEVGKVADVVVWDVADYRQLGYRFGANLADTVVKNGEVVTNIHK
jgi:imidazolonepropionase